MHAIRGAATPRSVLTRLRQATRDQHEALDRSFSAHGEAPGRARYVALLRGSLAVLTQLEPRIARFLTGFESERVPLLRADLSRLGALAAVNVRAPAIESLAEAFGAAYVVEGSALGGLSLARSLRRAASIDAGALAYLELRGGATGAHWNAFLARLALWGEAARASELEQACASAQATFSAYQRAIDQAEQA